MRALVTACSDLAAQISRATADAASLFLPEDGEASQGSRETGLLVAPDANWQPREGHVFDRLDMGIDRGQRRNFGARPGLTRRRTDVARKSPPHHRVGRSPNLPGRINNRPEAASSVAAGAARLRRLPRR